jgi:putative membrane protein
METKKNLISSKEIVFLYIIFIVGILGHLLPQIKDYMIALTPITLLITGTVVLFYSYKTSNGKFLIWTILTYIITFALEVIGVKSGLVFGEYSYGSSLGFKVFEVPLIIGFNWVFVILGSISISLIITDKKVLIVLLSALISLIFDFVLEPVAIKLNYWQWNEGVIPIQNFVAWFVIAFLAASIFMTMQINVKSKASIHYLLIQYVFFLILLFFYR